MTPTTTQDNLSLLSEQFANVFSYPGADYKKHVVEISAGVFQDDDWETFHKYIADSNHCDIEELFTSTFDMNPASCLEIGWHLYGESYQRGEFMVHLRRELASQEIQESCELPDHLSHVLKLMGKQGSDENAEFVPGIVIPAAEKIRDGVKEDNPFRASLNALHNFLTKNYKTEETV